MELFNATPVFERVRYRLWKPCIGGHYQRTASKNPLAEREATKNIISPIRFREMAIPRYHLATTIRSNYDDASKFEMQFKCWKFEALD